MLKSPYPYFGGKSSVASVVWNRFGDVPNYVEPFFGSGAILLGRPHKPKIETVNDIDGFISNFWRAVKSNPEAVAYYVDWPVNENDLLARHIWLVNQTNTLTEKLHADPEYYDVKVAGWWCWGICSWIGSGWCSGRGPWRIVDGMLEKGNAGQGVNRKLPHLGDAGRGVNRQLPHLGDAGRGVNRQLPHLGNAGRGVNRQLPHLGDAGRGVNRQLPHLGDAGQGGVYSKHIRDMMQKLSDRLRRVRVCCGDWTRILGNSPTVKLGMTAVFLDPPYANTAGRTNNLYAKDSISIAHDVREWAIANGDNPLFRIALCGYEHEHRMPESWEIFRWSARGGYGLQGNGKGLENRKREIIWFSPHCLKTEQLRTLSLFE